MTTSHDSSGAQPSAPAPARQVTASGLSPAPVQPTGAPGQVPPGGTDPTMGASQNAASIPPPAAEPDPLIGTTIDGRYKVEGTLGEGGMGVVYRGRHKVIDKQIAIKVLRAEFARDNEITQRFLQEAKAASSLNNPHIIDISDFGTLPDGSTYFIMEFLYGMPLTDVIESADEPMGVKRLTSISKQIAEGLAVAHEQQIFHRDLKPDNIFLVDHGSEKDFVKILDFGIAKIGKATSKLTRQGSVFGTPHYMSPEQAAGSPLDHRTDVYSLGVIMYEMASGRVPFDADNFMGILTKHMYEAPAPPRALVPAPQDLPPGLEAVILKCLSKKPEQRYQSMNDLIEDLDRFEQGLIPEAVQEMMARSSGFNVPADYFNKAAMPAPMPASPLGTQGGSKKLLVLGGVGVVLLLAAVAIIAVAMGKKTPQPAAASSSAVASAATSVAPTTTSPTPPPSASAAADDTGTKVMLTAEPINAEIVADDKTLGMQPQTILVPEGKVIKVTVRAVGYRPKVVDVDGSKTRIALALRPKGSSAPAPTPTKTSVAPPPTHKPKPRPKPKPNGGSGEIVNPWAH